MFEDEALGFCYALQCYSSQNEQVPVPNVPYSIMFGNCHKKTRQTLQNDECFHLKSN